MYKLKIGLSDNISPISSNKYIYLSFHYDSEYIESLKRIITSKLLSNLESDISKAILNTHKWLEEFQSEYHYTDISYNLMASFKSLWQPQLPGSTPSDNFEYCYEIEGNIYTYILIRSLMDVMDEIGCEYEIDDNCIGMIEQINDIIANIHEKRKEYSPAVIFDGNDFQLKNIPEGIKSSFVDKPIHDVCRIATDFGIDIINPPELVNIKGHKELYTSRTISCSNQDNFGGILDYAIEYDLFPIACNRKFYIIKGPAKQRNLEMETIRHATASLGNAHIYFIEDIKKANIHNFKPKITILNSLVYHTLYSNFIDKSIRLVYYSNDMTSPWIKGPEKLYYRNIGIEKQGRINIKG